MTWMEERRVKQRLKKLVRKRYPKYDFGFSAKVLIVLIAGYLLVFGFLCSQCSGGEMEMKEPPARMKKISEQFGLSPVMVIGKHWMFVLKTEKSRFGGFPVVVPEGATDAQVKLALEAASTVAMYYEKEIANWKPE